MYDMELRVELMSRIGTMMVLEWKEVADDVILSAILGRVLPANEYSVNFLYTCIVLHPSTSRVPYLAKGVVGGTEFRKS